MVALNKDGGVRELVVSGIMALQVLLMLQDSSHKPAAHLICACTAQAACSAP